MPLRGVIIRKTKRVYEGIAEFDVLGYDSQSESEFL